MNFGDEGWIASIQPEDGVAQDGLSPCGKNPSILRSTIPISRKYVASRSLDVQHHQEKQKLDHYITPANHRSYNPPKPNLALRNSLPIKPKSTTKIKQKPSTTWPPFKVQGSRLYSPEPIPDECHLSKFPFNSDTDLLVDPADPGDYHPSPPVTGQRQVKKEPRQLGGGKEVGNATPSPVCQLNNPASRQNQQGLREIPVEAEERLGSASAQFFYDLARDMHIEKALPEGKHKRVVKGFPKFPELPPEIRMRIFEYAGVAWGANNVYITCHRRDQLFQYATSACHRAQGLGDSTPRRLIPDYWPYELRASYKLPPLLRTNHEARIAAQKFYKLSFAYQLTHSCGVWFDCTRDKLIMGSGGAFDFFKHGAKDTEEDRSEQRKVEKTLRYLVIRSLFGDEVIGLCRNSHGLEYLDALHLGGTSLFCPGLQSYEGNCFMRAAAGLRGRWKQAVDKGEIARAPEVYTRHSGDFEKRLGLCEDEDPDDLRFTSLKIMAERLISN